MAIADMITPPWSKTERRHWFVLARLRRGSGTQGVDCMTTTVKLTERVERLWIAVAVATVLIASASCTREKTIAGREARRYTPTARAITITTVPLLVKEEQTVLPFLKEDFAKGGMLEGKEVYGFSPSTIT